MWMLQLHRPLPLLSFTKEQCVLCQREKIITGEEGEASVHSSIDELGWMEKEVLHYIRLKHMLWDLQFEAQKLYFLLQN